MITFPKTAIYDVCSKDRTDWPEVMAVHYNAEKGQLEATDNYMAAVVKVDKPDDATDEDVFIPPKVMKAALKDGMMWIEDGMIHLFDDSQYPVVEGEAFPNIDALKPKNVQWVTSLNAELLYKVAKAICYETRREPAVSIWRGNHYGALLITRVNDYVCNDYGLVMPFSDSVVENMQRVPTLNNLALAGHTVMISPTTLKDHESISGLFEDGVAVSISNGHSGVGKTLDDALLDAYAPKH